jgi:peptidylprolyl isomerase
MKRIIFALLFTMFHLSVFSQSKDTVTTQSGLKYVQVLPGKGNNPKDGQKLKVRYRGTLKDGTIFDSNMEDAPFKFSLGAKEVIPGWDEGFKLMKAGEKGYLIIPARLGYGKKGVKSPDDPKKYVIPPDSDLIFEVELISIK